MSVHYTLYTVYSNLGKHIIYDAICLTKLINKEEGFDEFIIISVLQSVANSMVPDSIGFSTWAQV